MHSHLKKLLIAMIIALPTLSGAAESSPAAETQNPLPVPPAVTAPALPAIAKPVEAAPIRQSPKLGHVDIVRIGSESDRGKALKTLLSSKKDSLQNKIDGKKKQIEKLKNSIEAKLPSMTPQQREAKSKEFQKKLEDFQKLARSSEEEFYELQEKETKALYEEIEKAADAYGKSNNFAVIVVKKELLYIGDAVDTQDITDALIKSLNASGAKK